MKKKSLTVRNILLVLSIMFSAAGKSMKVHSPSPMLWWMGDVMETAGPLLLVGLLKTGRH